MLLDRTEALRQVRAIHARAHDRRIDRALGRGRGKERPEEVLRDLLLMFAAANGGSRSVPMCCFYGGTPFGQFRNPVPYLWSRFKHFIEALGNPELNRVVADLGMDCSD